MATITQMIEATGVDVVTDFTDAEIPVLAGTQRQGDVLVTPIVGILPQTRVPAAGTPVVRGESGGNTHTIIAADGPVYCDVATPSPRSLRVALLSVPEGSAAYLAHPEHGFMGIAPGSYEVRRQREMAEEMRMVAD